MRMKRKRTAADDTETLQGNTAPSSSQACGATIYLPIRRIVGGIVDNGTIGQMAMVAVDTGGPI